MTFDQLKLEIRTIHLIIQNKIKLLYLNQANRFDKVIIKMIKIE